MPHSSANSPARVRGFTLLELMVVIVIIGVMTGVIVAEMRGTFEDALLRASARKLMDAANVANARAVARNEAHILTLDLANHRYSVRRDQQTALEGELDERVRIELRDLEMETAEAEEPRERNVIRFLPDGTADPIEILLRDRAGGVLRLRMTTAIARLRVIESPGP